MELGIAAADLEATEPDVMEAMLDYLEDKAKEAQREGLRARLRGQSWQ